MKFIFETTNLDERTYKRIIQSYIASQLSRLGRIQFIIKNRNYQIVIRPMERASESPFFHGKDGVGGVTDPLRMILYLEDKRDHPKDSVQRVIRKNLTIITHEMGHKLFMDAGFGHKVPLRNDDEMGHKAGTLLNFWTAEVHDRDIENFSYSKEFYIYDEQTNKAWKYNFNVLDFRDLLK